MWGAGSAFEDFEAFLESMKKRGVSFLEMLAMEMKLEGESFLLLHLPIVLLQPSLEVQMYRFWRMIARIRKGKSSSY